MLSSLIGFFALIGILVTIHEYGHLLAAKQCGVKVEAFSVGFGPVLWSKVAKDGVEYRLSAIPLGGYVKMKDELVVEQPEGEQVAQETQETQVDSAENLAFQHSADPDSFYSQTWWEKVYISFAGPLANIVFAVFAFMVLALFPHSVTPPIVASATNSVVNSGDKLTEINGRAMHDPIQHVEYLLYQCLKEQPLDMVFTGEHGRKDIEVIPKAEDCLNHKILGIYAPLGIKWYESNRIAVKEGDPAQQAGLKNGDTIVAINGVKTPTFDHIYKEISQSDGKALEVMVENEDGQLSYAITPKKRPKDDNNTKDDEKTEDDESKYIIGIYPMGETYRSPIGEAIFDGFSRTINTIRLTPLFISKMISRGEVEKTIGGPIAIGKIAGNAVNTGISAFLEIAAMLSISLAVLNLLPIPILDGGRIVQHTIEGVVLHRPMRDATVMRLQQIGMIFILALTFFALYNDITSL